MPVSAVGVLVALLAVDAAGLGALRAWTVRLWREGTVTFRQGGWLTPSARAAG